MKVSQLDPGAVLQNRYRILSLLKQGGMGRVYLAEDQRFRSQVAVKDALFTKENFRRAFAHEAGLLHRLHHQALPHVTDHFTEGEGEYLVMQFFPGKDLEELLAEKKQKTGEAFAVERVLGWTDQLLDALEYLHAHQPPIVHRDIKPQNLKLTERGEVILLDFGLAKGEAIEMSQAGESVPGYTYHYAPLEQIRGTGTDPRSDLYALAATIYRLVTASFPPDAMMRAAATIEGRADPLQPANKLNDQVPEAVAAVLMRAMAQLPAERLATATEMRQALRAARQANVLSDNHPAPSTDGSGAEIALPSEEPGEELGEELEIAGSGGANHSASVITNAGRMMAPSPAPGADDPTTATTVARFGPGVTWTVRVALGLLLLAIALGYWRLTSPSGSDAVIAARPNSSTPMQTPFEEVMRYYLQVESDAGRAERVAGAEPVLEGRWLKFHFTPSRPGYLYIIGPGEGPGGRAVRTTFLTAQPNPAWGIRSNLLAAGATYSFPSRRNQWIEVTGSANVRTYVIFFASEPLAQPGFLAGAANHALTPTEEDKLAELRKQFGQQVLIQTQGDQSIVTVPAEQASGAPFLFEIHLRRRTDQEKGER